MTQGVIYNVISTILGAIAQLGEHYAGSVEVGGSIPPGSTNNMLNITIKSPSSRGLGHCPFTAATGVRIPLGTPLYLLFWYLYQPIEYG